MKPIFNSFFSIHFHCARLFRQHVFEYLYWKSTGLFVPTAIFFRFVCLRAYRFCIRTIVTVCRLNVYGTIRYIVSCIIPLVCTSNAQSDCGHSEYASWHSPSPPQDDHNIRNRCISHWPTNIIQHRAIAIALSWIDLAQNFMNFLKLNQCFEANALKIGLNSSWLNLRFVEN